MYIQGSNKCIWAVLFVAAMPLLNGCDVGTPDSENTHSESDDELRASVDFETLRAEYLAPIDHHAQLSGFDALTADSPDELARAISIQRSVVNDEPGNLGNLLILSRLEWENGEYEEMLTTYLDARECHVPDAESQLELAFLAYVIGNYVDAYQLANVSGKVLRNDARPALLTLLTLHELPLKPEGQDELINELLSRVRAIAPEVLETPFVLKRTGKRGHQ